jgi:hypothetical protein
MVIVMGLGILPTPRALAQFDPASGTTKVEPVAGATYGVGYDVTRRMIFPQGGGCVSVNTAQTYESGPSPQAVSDFSARTTYSQMTEAMHLSASLKVMMALGGSAAGVGFKSEFLQKVTSTEFKQSVFAQYHANDNPRYVDLTYVQLKPEYAAMLADPARRAEFLAKCGSGFVFGIQRGSEFYGAAWVDQQSLTTWTQYQGLAAAGVGSSQNATSADIAIAQSMNSTFGAANVHARSVRTDITGINTTDVASLISAFQQYGNLTGPRADLKLIIAPYAFAAGYPPSDPLGPLPNDDMLEVLGNALWDLRALIDDSDFIIKHPDQHALGVSPGKRQQRLNDVQQLQTAWRRELANLGPQVQSCMSSFAASCSALAGQYSARNLPFDRGLLPSRYTSNCGQRVDLSGSQVAGRIGTYQMPDSTVQGDAEMFGGPVQAEGWLTYFPSGRELWVRLRTKLRETKGDFSTFDYTLEKPVGNLDGPLGPVSGSLSECDFDGTGVPAAAGLVNTHGYVSWKSDPTPRGIKKIVGGAGLLSALNCELDRDGTDGGLQCQAPEIRDSQVTLVNRSDKEAEAWVPTLNRGAIVAAFAAFADRTMHLRAQTGAPTSGKRAAAPPPSGKELQARSVGLLMDERAKAALQRQADRKAMVAAMPASVIQVLSARLAALGANQGGKAPAAALALPVPPKPAPAAAQPTQVPPKPAPVAAQPMQVPPKPAPVAAQPLPVSPNPASSATFSPLPAPLPKR